MAKVSKQTYILAGICLFDLVSTLYLLLSDRGAEANPLMAYFLVYGTCAFILAKVALMAGPLVLLEWARRKAPVFVRRASTLAIAAYIVFYISGTVRANSVSYADEFPQTAQDKLLWANIQRDMEIKRHRALVPSSPSLCQGHDDDIADSFLTNEGSVKL